MRRQLELASPEYYLLGKRIYFFLSGKSKNQELPKIIARLSRKFPIHSFQIILSNTPHTVAEFTHQPLAQDSLFIVVGDDGTLSSAIQYLANSPATIGVVPNGCANDLAAVFGIHSNSAKALKIIGDGYSTSLDTVKVNSQHLLTIGSIGFPAAVVATMHRLKTMRFIRGFMDFPLFRSMLFKIFALALPVLRGSEITRHSARVSVDGNPFFEGEFAAVFFGKQCFFSKFSRSIPDATQSEPFLMLSVLKFSSLLQLLKDMLELGRGRPERIKNLIVTKCQSFQIETERFQHLLGDGEILDFNDEFFGKRIPQALRMLVPQSHGETGK